MMLDISNMKGGGHIEGGMHCWPVHRKMRKYLGNIFFHDMILAPKRELLKQVARIFETPMIFNFNAVSTSPPQSEKIFGKTYIFFTFFYHNITC